MADGKSTMCADTTSIATPVNNVEMIAASSRKKSISDLPVNLVEEILSRVPLKSMRAVRLTCKQWEALSKSRSFSKMHIGKLTAEKEGESLMIAMMDYNLYLMKVVLVDNEDPFIECQGKLTCVDKISQVFHCDGLLLCVLKDDDDTKVIVWNPYWGQTRSIQESTYSHRPDDGWESWERFNYALGYEEKVSSSPPRRRAYKFLRFIDRYSRYEIYDFESSSWKSLDDVIPHWSILCGQGGVSLEGNTYWPASQRNTEEDELDDHIICFDFTSESFGPLLRLPFDAGRHDCVTLSCVGEEKLAVLLTPNEVCPTEFDIWISTKIEAGEVLWSKFLRVVATELAPLITGDSFLVDEEKKVVMGFEDDFSKTFNIVGEAGYLGKMELVERVGRDGNCRANVCSYVPSLVQISQPASGRKRKQQCRLGNATI